MIDRCATYVSGARYEDLFFEDLMNIIQKVHDASNSDVKIVGSEKAVSVLANNSVFYKKDMNNDEHYGTYKGIPIEVVKNLGLFYGDCLFVIPTKQ